MKETVKLTAEFQDFLIDLIIALTLPTSNTSEHKWIEASVKYFRNLTHNPHRQDRAFKQEVNDLWIILGNCANNTGNDETTRVFLSLQSRLKKLKLARKIYQPVKEDATQHIRKLSSFSSQQSSFQ